MRLSEATAEEVEEQGQEILQLNERLKQIFGGQRNRVVP